MTGKTVHILVDPAGWTYACGVESTPGEMRWPGWVARDSDEGLCERCLEREPMARLALMDLGQATRNP